MFRTLIVGAVLLVVGLAYVITSVVDDLAPAGSTDIITVWDSDASVDGSFQTLVQTSAAAHDMTVLKEVRSDSGDGVTRLEYVANRDAAQRFRTLDHASTGFDPTLVTRPLPLSELPDNRINGMYVTDAGTASARAFAASLSEAGVAVTVSPLSPLFVSLWVADEAPVVPLSGCLLIAMVIGVTRWQATRRGTSAIAAVHGRGIARSASRDAAEASWRTIGYGAVAIGVAALVVTIHNGGSRLGTFIAVATIGILASAAFVSSSTIIAALIPRRSITQSIAGSRPWRCLLAVALVGNVVALALMSEAATTSWNSIELARRDSLEQDDWHASRDDVRLTFESSVAELDAAETGLADVYARLDAHGSAILVDHALGPDGMSHAPDVGNVLIVNAQYLREQTIRPTAGGRVTPEQLNPHALSLLVPDGVQLTGSDRRAWREFLTFQRALSSATEAVIPAPAIDEVGVERGRVFDYATDDLTTTSTLDAPVIAVLPTSAGSVSANYLAANMTTGEVVFSDEAALRSELASHGLARTVASVEPLRDIVTYRSATIRRQLAHAVESLGVVALVLLWSASLTGQAIATVRCRRTTIELLHGRSRIKAIGPALVLPATAIVGTASALVAVGPPEQATASMVCAALDIVVLSLATWRLLRKEELP